MKFTFDERPSDSPLVERVWHTRSEGEAEGAFTSTAVSHGELVFTRQRGSVGAVLRGPETKATLAPVPGDAEMFGLKFRLGTFLPHLPTSKRVDGALVLPGASANAFWLNGSAWPFPDFEDADTFVDRLARTGLLARDPIVEAALRGEPADLSARSVQRRFLQATGLTHGAIRQIEQARQAAALLEQGVPIPDVVYLAGYFDQPHLTRAMKHRIGRTPAQLTRASSPG